MSSITLSSSVQIHVGSENVQIEYALAMASRFYILKAHINKHTLLNNIMSQCLVILFKLSTKPSDCDALCS